MIDRIGRVAEHLFYRMLRFRVSWTSEMNNHNLFYSLLAWLSSERQWLFYKKKVDKMAMRRGKHDMT